MIVTGLYILCQELTLFQGSLRIEWLELYCELGFLQSVNPDKDDAVLTLEDMLGLGSFEDLGLSEVFLAW